MRNYFVIFFIFLLRLQFLNAQDSLEVKKYNMIIKADIFAISSFFFTPNYLAFSSELNKARQGFQFSTLYAWYNGAYRIFDTYQEMFDYKFFLNRNKNSTGFYCGGYTKYIRYHDKFYSEYDEYYNLIAPQGKLKAEHISHRVAIGGITGYQMYFEKHLCIDILIGLGIRKNIYITDPDNYFNISTTKFFPDGRLGLNVGYKF